MHEKSYLAKQAISCLAWGSMSSSQNFKFLCHHVTPKAVPYFSPTSLRFSVALWLVFAILAAILSCVFQLLSCGLFWSQVSKQMVPQFSMCSTLVAPIYLSVTSKVQAFKHCFLTRLLLKLLWSPKFSKVQYLSDSFFLLLNHICTVVIKYLI